jgi:hypothetical protein
MTYQIGGNHYKSEYEHWDWVRDVSVGFLVGSLIKYLIRWRKKDGVDDLKKARTFLLKTIETRNFPGAPRHYRQSGTDLAYTKLYIETNNIPKQEAEIIYLVSGLCFSNDTTRALVILNTMIKEQESEKNKNS